MVIWFALFIPVLSSVLMLILFRHKFVWWELLLPTIVCLIFITIFKISVEKIQTTDTEYRGSIIMSARYVEPYSTWIHRTCTRTYKCGKSTCTTTYDCSYCDYNPERFYVSDDQNNTWSISRSYFDILKSKWNSKPEFVDLNRSINYHFSCGKDGDAYDIFWDGRKNTSEASVSTHWYENRVQAAHTAFSYEEVPNVMADSIGLFKYPELYNTYKQQCVFGIDKLYTTDELNQIYTDFEYLNGYCGTRHKVKVFILVFQNKNMSIANHQEAYWDGGNDNELVICMSIDPKTKIIQWVKPFSWTSNRRCIVECRENIAELNTINFTKMYSIVLDVNQKYFKPRDFKEFSYVTVEPPTWAVIVTYIITLIITIAINYWGYNNDI